MIISIVLALGVGLLVLWICKQYKHISFLEQMVLGLALGLSIAVLLLFLQGHIADRLSLTPMIVLFIILFIITLYLHNKHRLYTHIKHSLTSDISTIWGNFLALKLWKKILVIAILLYGVRKVFMVFMINTHMPTYDEDAVAGWDMKTKIFTEHKSLVLDNHDDEFYGSDLSRYPFAGLLDTYLLLHVSKDNIVGNTNIISPIVYLLTLLLLLAIFSRLTSLFFANIMAYIYLSLPFLFIHGIGSYWNFISGFLLFLLIFYYIDQVILAGNKSIIIGLLPIGILYGILRNEAFILIILITIALILYDYIITKKIWTKSNYLLIAMLVVIFAIIHFITSLYPLGIDLNPGGIKSGTDMLSSAFVNITKPGVFLAPFIQAFYHPDYNLFFILYSIAIIYSIWHWKKLSYIRSFLLLSLALLAVFMITLYANVEGLGLITHFAFIRYPLGIIHLLLFVAGYALYHLTKKIDSGK